jgi:hypothetical protein
MIAQEIEQHEGFGGRGHNQFELMWHHG